MAPVNVRIPTIALAAVLIALAPPAAAAAAQPQAVAAAAGRVGGSLTRSDNTPFKPSGAILGARWTSARYDPPGNQWGDILPTVWSDDGGTYVLMDDGGVDVPVQGGLWRQSFARVTGKPPNLRFTRIGRGSPPARTWAQIGSNPDNDDGPLGPYYSVGFAEVDGIFYATLQHNWNWTANAPFAGLAGMAYSRDHGKTWHVVNKPFHGPLGNLTFIDGGGRGGRHPDGYVYAIGTGREFNASGLLLGRARPGLANMTNPASWQWFAGFQGGAGGTQGGAGATQGTQGGATGTQGAAGGTQGGAGGAQGAAGGAQSGAGGTGSPVWASSPKSATPVLSWGSHITYPAMTYDAPLHRYLLTFTYSYSQRPPGVWTRGAELVILEAPSPLGPFSFVARSKEFGPSNGYGAGFPSQWISRNGRDLWLKWAANFDGCGKGLDCSGKYGYNVARVHLTVAPQAKPAIARRVRHVAYALSASALLLLALIGFARRSGRFL